MNINEVYGDEAISEDFLVALRRKGYSLGNLFNKGTRFAAQKFIDIAVEMDLPMGDEYYSNLGILCLDLSRNYPDFHEILKQNIAEIKDDLPQKASLLLYNQ